MPAEERNPSAQKADVGWLGVVDPPFVLRTTRGTDPRPESCRYGWNIGTPQLELTTNS